MKRRKRVSKSVPAKGRLKDMADRLWSLAVREDWNHCCAVCGRGKCESHHLIPRQHQATRYDVSNGITLCAQHHKFDPNVSPHQNAAGWLAWLLEHHQIHYRWYGEAIESGSHKRFEGTTNAAYYCDIIRGLKEYVDESDYTSIVGVRFSQFLEEQE